MRTAEASVYRCPDCGLGFELEIEMADGKRSLIPFKIGIADLEGDRIVLDSEFLA